MTDQLISQSVSIIDQTILDTHCLCQFVALIFNLHFLTQMMTICLVDQFAYPPKKAKPYFS